MMPQVLHEAPLIHAPFQNDKARSAGVFETLEGHGRLWDEPIYPTENERPTLPFLPLPPVLPLLPVLPR